MNWSIIEEESYDRAVAQIRNHQHFDEVFALISYGLHRNPLGFPQTQIPGIYIAKTKLYISGLEVVPSYRLWFRAVTETKTVHLLWVDIAPPEDMAFWDDEDDHTI